MGETQQLYLSGLGATAVVRPITRWTFTYGLTVSLEWKGNSNSRLTDCKYSGKGG